MQTLRFMSFFKVTNDLNYTALIEHSITLITIKLLFQFNRIYNILEGDFFYFFPQHVNS